MKNLKYLNGSFNCRHLLLVKRKGWNNPKYSTNFDEFNKFLSISWHKQYCLFSNKKFHLTLNKINYSSTVEVSNVVQYNKSSVICNTNWTVVNTKQRKMQPYVPTFPTILSLFSKKYICKHSVVVCQRNLTNFMEMNDFSDCCYWVIKRFWPNISIMAAIRL